MQQTFGFIDEPPRRPARPERLFFGILPDAAAARRIGRRGDRLARDRGLEGTRIADDRLHLSLHHVGDYWRLAPRFIYAADHAGTAAEAPPPFEVTLHALETFPDAPRRDASGPRRPLVLLAKGDGLSEMHEGLGAALRKAGLRAGAHFNPHVTLLYGPDAVPREPIDPIRFMVSGFALIHSARGLGRYNILRRWPLTARPADEAGRARARRLSVVSDLAGLAGRGTTPG